MAAKKQRLWDVAMADRAAAIRQAEQLGGVVLVPPEDIQIGFTQTEPQAEKPDGVAG